MFNKKIASTKITHIFFVCSSVQVKVLLIVVSALGAVSYAVFAVLIAEPTWLQVRGI